MGRTLYLMSFVFTYLCPFSRESPRETHLSAQQSQASKQARFSDPHAHSWRAGRHRPTPAQGPQTPRRLSSALTETPKPWIRGSYLWARIGRESSGTVFVLRKNLGKAVKRNRLKRRLRHLCQLHPPEHAGRSLVILPQRGAADLSFYQLGIEFKQVLSKVKGYG